MRPGPTDKEHEGYTQLTQHACGKYAEERSFVECILRGLTWFLVILMSMILSKLTVLQTMSLILPDTKFTWEATAFLTHLWFVPYQLMTWCNIQVEIPEHCDCISEFKTCQNTRQSNSCTYFRTNSPKANKWMPKHIGSSEPRRWMVFGHLVMPVECCSDAWPTGQVLSSALTPMI